MKRIVTSTLTVGAIALVSIPSIALAARVFSTSLNGTKIYCSQSGSSYTAGRMSGGRFQSNAQIIKALKKKISATSNKATLAKLKKSLNSAIARRSAEDKKCKAVGGTPSTSPTPTPTQSGNFDSSGNTTAFGIPSGTTGNVSRGKSTHSSVCSGCHGDKTGIRYSAISSAISNEPSMFGISLSRQEQADITAYLNRFNN